MQPYHIPLRDYEYLDKNRLLDYLTTLDVDQVKEIKQTIREVSDKPDGLGVDFLIRAVGLGSQPEVQKEDHQIEDIIAKQSFNLLYDRLIQMQQIKRRGDPIYASDFDDLSGTIIETRRSFKQLDHRVIDLMARILELAYERYDNEVWRRKAGLLRSYTTKKMMMVAETLLPQRQSASEQTKSSSDTSRSYTTKKVMKVAETLLPQRQSASEQTKSSSDASDGEVSEVERCSIVFSSDTRFLIRGPEEFMGELTVCGKVKEVIEHEQTIGEQLFGIPSGEISTSYHSLESTYKRLVETAVDRDEDPGSNWWSKVRDRLSGRAQQERHLREVTEKQKRKWTQIREESEEVDLKNFGIQCPVIVITPLAVYR